MIAEPEWSIHAHTEQTSRKAIKAKIIQARIIKSRAFQSR
jgi:hypothetical protein